MLLVRVPQVSPLRLLPSLVPRRFLDLWGVRPPNFLDDLLGAGVRTPLPHKTMIARDPTLQDVQAVLFSQRVSHALLDEGSQVMQFTQCTRSTTGQCGELENTTRDWTELKKQNQGAEQVNSSSRWPASALLP